MDDELYDYYGSPLRTYQDDECIEIMEDILRRNEFSSMPDSDQILLEEFAPKLFNTATYDKKIIEYMMLDLVSAVRGYRKGILGFKFVNKRGVRLTKQSDEVIENALSKHAKAILEILGDPSKGEIDYPTENHHVLEGLMQMVDNPRQFLQMEIKETPATKTQVKSRLQKFKLPHKTQTIEEFINKLDN